MDNFYTSTEAAQITGCSRRQLQYWREKGVVVPTVNPSGKGRNVYYSQTDLLALTVMEYLLSMGLSFEVCQEVLETLKASESWLFQPSVLEGQMKRFMLLLDLKRQCLVSFDSGLALETINQGLPVVPFWSDRIHQRLRDNLSSFATAGDCIV
ncbi:MerR family transcriptional regulator [Coleofasciculus sp. H7-2]|uniref:MerR family transcriptional regulator n=1 Tax=Coleofasciculus sp. H7-2 TaxID=3351545 RepID=UPI00366DB649